MGSFYLDVEWVDVYGCHVTWHKRKCKAIKTPGIAL